MFKRVILDGFLNGGQIYLSCTTAMGVRFINVIAHSHRFALAGKAVFCEQSPFFFTDLLFRFIKNHCYRLGDAQFADVGSWVFWRWLVMSVCRRSELVVYEWFS